MLIEFHPERHEAYSEHRTCGYHKKNPSDHSYAGCTCSSTYGLRTLPFEEWKEPEKTEKEKLIDWLLDK